MAEGLVLLILVLAVALIFDYINGFHDAANAIATVVSTGVLPIRTAVIIAGIFNFAGAVMGTAVAKTIASGFADGGDVTQALVGGLMRTTCVTKKLAGLVIDGAVRDLTEWAEEGMPIFAKGHTHRGPSKDGPGEINIPVSCAGLVVLPGDLVVGDADGVIAVPAAEVEQVLVKTHAHLKKEAAIREGNRTGTTDAERFDATLRAKGLPV